MERCQILGCHHEFHQSLCLIWGGRGERPSPIHHVAIQTHYHFPASSLIPWLAGRVYFNGQDRVHKSGNWAFNNKGANYPSLRDASLCFSKVRLVLYLKVPKSLSKPLGPPESQNCFFSFFLFWHFRKEIWGIRHRKHHTPKGDWGSRLPSNTVFLQEKKKKKEWLFTLSA